MAIFRWRRFRYHRSLAPIVYLIDPISVRHIKRTEALTTDDAIDIDGMKSLKLLYRCTQCIII